ncbi:MAG: hypothetical protein GC134_01375 [Proteobacteria bacterium]|nr:hypothetical protein [Pseudomonadota bacterium]
MYWLDKDILGITAAALGGYSQLYYIFVILRGRARPHMFSFLIWGTVMGIAAAAQWSAGAGAGVWWTTVSALGCLGIALLAVFKGEKNITRSDRMALIAAFSAIPLWYATKEPLFSVLLVTTIDVVGFYPTFRKSYIRPFEESALAFFIGGFSSFLSVLALGAFTATTVLYPAIIAVTNAVFVSMLLWRRRALGSTMEAV